MTTAQRKELEYIRAGKGMTYFLARNSPAKVAMLKRMAAKGYITFVEEPAGIADCYITPHGETALTPTPAAPRREDGEL